MSEGKIYLTFGKDSQGRKIAIMSLGSPQHGDEMVTVLTLEVVKSTKEAKAWFKRMLVERPWETRQ